MTATPDREPTLADIAQQINELRNISQQISELRADLEQSRQDLKAEVERWDERFFQFTRDNLTTARTIIITAGSVVILSPVLQAFAPAIQTVVKRLLRVDAPQ
jgi:septal ring factor EnvC (AmiA/AmiB activator)